MKCFYIYILGVAFGTGSAIAHRAVDAVMGPRVVQHEHVPTETPAAASPAVNNAMGNDSCGIHSKAFQDVCHFVFLHFLSPSVYHIMTVSAIN